MVIRPLLLRKINLSVLSWPTEAAAAAVRAGRRMEPRLKLRR